MNTLVLLKLVPDIVEELEVGADATSLDLDVVRPIVSEPDDHALEQALLLKDRHGGAVTVLAFDAPEIDDVLYTALAKGCDRAVKVTGVEPPLATSEAAALLAAVLGAAPDLLGADLIVAGCQAIDDLDGLLAAGVAERLGRPYVGIVTGADLDGGALKVLKEYAGGVRAEYAVALPAVLGVQAAEKPPRYVPVAKVRATMKARTIDTLEAPARGAASGVAVVRMTKPEAGGAAEMLAGSPDEVAAKLVEILASRGLL